MIIHTCKIFLFLDSRKYFTDDTKCLCSIMNIPTWLFHKRFHIHTIWCKLVLYLMKICEMILEMSVHKMFYRYIFDTDTFVPSWTLVKWWECHEWFHRQIWHEIVLLFHEHMRNETLNEMKQNFFQIQIFFVICFGICS